MREVKDMKVEIVDENHIFVNNKQFISLKRFADAKKDVANEIKLLNDKNKELAEENEALKVLLKKQLDDVVVIDDPLVKTLANRMCESESDHEWECTGLSTAGSHYRCKKCNATKIYSTECHELSMTI